MSDQCFIDRHDVFFVLELDVRTTLEQFQDVGDGAADVHVLRHHLLVHLFRTGAQVADLLVVLCRVAEVARDRVGVGVVENVLAHRVDAGQVQTGETRVTAHLILLLYTRSSVNRIGK
ncbi:hypothetical protein D3C80_1580890 [compost metagenome]